MGAYLDRLTADVKAAMKAGEKEKLTVLRMIISDIKKKAEAEGDLSDEAEMAILQKAVKTRADTVEQATAAGRHDLADQEAGEIDLIQGYLPKEMDAAEVEEKVRALAAELGYETAWFKNNVRKLKALGLTESLEVGYRLSPRGRAFLEK